MSLNANGVGAEGLLAAAGTLARPSEEFGNDERVEALWAMKAYEHAEVYFNILCCVDPSQIPRLSPCDEEIYATFRKEFPDMKVDVLDEMKDLKSDARGRCFTGSNRVFPRGVHVEQTERLGRDPVATLLVPIANPLAGAGPNRKGHVRQTWHAYAPIQTEIPTCY